MVNDMRRQVIRQLDDLRIGRYRAKPHERVSVEAKFPGTEIDYRGNTANRLAKKFYRQHGITHIEDAFELQNDYQGKTLMTTKHCIKYQYGMCPALQRPSAKWKEPLYIMDQHHTYRLEFDCCACEMKVILK